MFHTHHKQTDPLFGLDISDQSLKIVQLKRHSNKIKMQAFGKYNLKDNIITKGEIKNSGALTTAIKELVSKPIFGSINTNNVVASLPENQSFIKLISIENSQNQLTDLVINEIEKFFPFSINKLYFDYQIINKYADSFDVLVSASPKDIVDSYIKAIQEAGLSVLALETESISLCRALISDKQTKKENSDTYAIIDIGGTESFMVICSLNSPIMSMSVDVSGEKITQNISTTLQITKAQAEKAKIICGLDKDKAEGIIHDILIKNTSKMANRIQDISDFYLDHYPQYKKISKIFISGGGSNVKKLNVILSKLLNIEVLDGDVFLNLTENPKKYNDKFTITHNLDSKLLKNKRKKSQKKETISSKHNSSLNYATAIGLALRDV